MVLTVFDIANDAANRFLFGIVLLIHIYHLFFVKDSIPKKRALIQTEKEALHLALYAMADLHLSFGCDKPMEIFGHRWDHHAQKIEAAWKNTVSETDTVIIPGDISWGIDLEQARADLLFLDSLPGKKWLGKGNHDYWWSTVRKMTSFFEREGIASLNFLYNCATVVEGKTLCCARGWFQDEKFAPKDVDYEKIVLREAGRLQLSLQDGQKKAQAAGIPFDPIVFLHFPPVFASYVCPELVDLMTQYGVKDCYYGHIHGAYDTPAIREYQSIRFHIIAADFLQFKPQQIETNV